MLQKARLVVVYVPGGDFLMGSGDDDPEAGEEQKPQHLVHVDGFWIGQTEVADAQYRKFIKAGGYEQRRYWTKDGSFFCLFRGCEDAAATLSVPGMRPGETVAFKVNGRTAHATGNTVWQDDKAVRLVDLETPSVGPCNGSGQ